ncbi:mismatch repair endonuclease PMS2 [Thrips palmi]|uniref:Mismatch repair endonuclease PMS2 n=1 Tax=Thrips palmi TaxID=161013 RepID=A0A6P8ZX47_THRPL|nr:mismatch repair endonuclease PMS2 [Thrips palmi]
MSVEEGSTAVPSPTKEKSKSIQAIDKEAVHRICSGQVVLNLATAMKELVENSLDAGATSVEIRLKEYGSELVEVIDNGCGVEEANFPGLTLKHHTSKIREFSDLLGVETFGFRGEALSSLCALSDLTVTTRHTSSTMGTRLTYDSRGSIINRTPCARQIGTTVTLANLFSPLPVRQKEFLRHLKREFAKMTQLLYAYCLISTGVKILCSNQTKKGGKNIIASTQGSASFKGNIMCIFGAKQASSLLDIELEPPSASHLEEIGLPGNIDDFRGFQLEGCVSSCSHGQGRSSTDRQFYFINNRPCDPVKVAKVVNEVYHQFNLHQFPFIFLNIKTARDSVDINVTPDKRQIFLDNEKLLVATVKASLLKLYEKIPHTYKVQNVAVGPTKSSSDICLPSANVSNESSYSSPNSTSSNKVSNFSSLLKSFSHSTAKNKQTPEFTSKDYSNLKTGRGVKRTLSSGNYDRDGKKQLCLSDFVSQKNNSSDNAEPLQHETVSISMDCDSGLLADSPHDMNDCTQETLESEVHCEELHSHVTSDVSSKAILQKPNESSSCRTETQPIDVEIEGAYPEKLPTESVHEQSSSFVGDECDRSGLEHISEQTTVPDQTFEKKCEQNTILFDSDKKEAKRKSVTFNVSMDKVQRLLSKSKTDSIIEKDCIFDKKPRVRFYAEIDPSKNKNAEQELSKEISKDMFSKMEIVGQFNLGFIVTKLGQDLFIIDQHATDEKYNFETLQTQTTLKNQKLVIPQALDLTAVNECILMDNMDIFLKNGFSFVIDKNAEPTKRVRLAAKPISHNWEFGKEDIDELLFMLQDSPNTMCRPSRVRAMFASRACRKSVMIGTALSKSTMRQLVNHMGEIEQPWNCPHGRPTMRHLVNLDLVRKRKEI